MNYSILFFELTLSLDTKAFRKQLDRAYKNVEKMDCRMYPVGFDHVDESFLSDGIGIRYYDNKHKKIRFVIYPGLVIGDDLSELWKPNSDNISRLRERFASFVSGYFNSDYELNDLKLTRVDYAVDINIGSKERVYDYLKLLKGIRRVKLFSPIKDPKHDASSFFGLKGRTNGVEFRAYSLKHDKEILRVEVRLTTKGVIRAYCDEYDTSKQIKAMAKNGKHIVLDSFQYIVPCGDHYKLKEARNIIMANVDDKTLRKNMLKLLELVKKRRSFMSVQKEFGRDFNETMSALEAISLSPITLGKRYKGKKIESLYKHMED